MRGRRSEPKRRRRPSRTVLHRELRRAARRFADEIVQLLAAEGLWDDERADGEGSVRVRRTGAALDRVAARVLEVLGQQSSPVAISAIAAALGTSPRNVAHPLNLLVADGKVERSGERRGTRYRLARPRTAPGRRKPGAAAHARKAGHKRTAARTGTTTAKHTPRAKTTPGRKTAPARNKAPGRKRGRKRAAARNKAPGRKKR